MLARSIRRAALSRAVRPVLSATITLVHGRTPRVLTATPCRALVRSLSSASQPQPSSESLVLTEHRGRVAVLTLNRPKALNALNDALMRELCATLRALDADSGVGCIVLTGSAKAFAAGADIKEMSDKDFARAYDSDMLAHWADVTKVRKPIIAAVNGYALGGGCELAMMCDIIIAGDSAKFGQPEVTIGTVPGGGGSQRLTRLVGKSKAMEMILTGEPIDANEALRFHLVARVVASDQLLDAAVTMATKIASFSNPIVCLAKECVNAALETSLSLGVTFERRLFHATFATADQKEGMRAFAQKPRATPQWQHK